MYSQKSARPSWRESDSGALAVEIIEVSGRRRPGRRSHRTNHGKLIEQEVVVKNDNSRKSWNEFNGTRMEWVVIAYVVNHGIKRVPEIGRVADFVPSNLLRLPGNTSEPLSILHRLGAHDRDRWPASLNPPATSRLKRPIAERAVVRRYPRDLHAKSRSIVAGHVTFMPFQSACGLPCPSSIVVLRLFANRSMAAARLSGSGCTTRPVSPSRTNV